MKGILQTQNDERKGRSMSTVIEKIKTFFSVLRRRYSCPWCGEACISAFAKMRLVSPLNARECPKCGKYLKVKLPWKNWLWTLAIALIGLILSLVIPYRYQLISPIIIAFVTIAVKDIFITVPRLPIIKD